MAEHMRTELVQNALEMAVRNCQPIEGVTIFHSDRGSQYTSADYTATMNKYGFLASVGRTGVCYDNAAAESFNATCKKELVNRKIYHTRRKAIKEVTSWIELCYNQTRLHSSLGYRTPNEVHQDMGENQDGSLNHNPSFSLPPTKPIAVHLRTRDALVHVRDRPGRGSVPHGLPRPPR